MADSQGLEQRVRDPNIHDSTARAPATQLPPSQGQAGRHSTADSIDDIADSHTDFYPNPSPSTLDTKLQLDKKTGFFGFMWDMVKYAPILAAQFAFLPAIVPLSSAITAFGLAIGARYEAKKAGKKFTWRRARKELYTGNMMGLAEYGLWMVPDLLSKSIPYFAQATFVARIAKLALFEALVVPPYMALYNGFKYTQNEMGWGKFFGKLLTLRWKSLFGEIYQKGIKGRTMRDSWETIKWLAPLHYIQTTYVPTPTLRMAQSLVINNPIFRYVQGKQDKKNIAQYDTPSPSSPQYNPRLNPSPG